MGDVNLRDTVKMVYASKDYHSPFQTRIIEVDWADIKTYGDTYKLLDIPAKSIVTRLIPIVVVAFTSGGSATITIGHQGGTEDDVDFYIDTTDGALANWAIRSAVGGEAAAFFSKAAADYEALLAYDTAAKIIDITIGTADLTAGKMYLVVEYMTIHHVA